jgi:hypothetical protein
MLGIQRWSRKPGRLSYILSLTLFFSHVLLANIVAAQATDDSAIKAAIKDSLEKAAAAHREMHALLKERYKVIEANPKSSNPFPTLVPRASAGGTIDSIDGQYSVLSVDPYDDKGFFRKQKLLLITVSYIFLEARIHSGHRSIGLFALDGTKLTYLNGTQSAANLSAVLKRENRPLYEADPQMLARLFATTILRQNNDRIDVVQSYEDVLAFDRPNAAKSNERLGRMHAERLYYPTVEKGELEKCRANLFKPQISNQTSGGWECRFIGVRGFTHTIRVPFALVQYDILISPTFEIKASEKILSPKIAT